MVWGDLVRVIDGFEWGFDGRGVKTKLGPGQRIRYWPISMRITTILGLSVLAILVLGSAKERVEKAIDKAKDSAYKHGKYPLNFRTILK